MKTYANIEGFCQDFCLSFTANWPVQLQNTSLISPALQPTDKLL